MNYQNIYDQLVLRAKNRVLMSEVYVEEHHIKPRCLGGDGTNKNLVLLLPEEHIFAHRLLCRIYPKNYDLVHAIFLLCGKLQGREARRIYAADKKRLANALKGNKFALGYKHTDEFKERIRQRHLGNKTSEDTKQKLKQKATGRIFTQAHKDAISAGLKRRKETLANPTNVSEEKHNDFNFN